MNDYKSTLNLPKTDFSMKGDLFKKEPLILEKWNTDDLYNHIRLSRKGKKKFFIQDGPPYANGNIHLGHALNKILKDIIIKSKIMSGFDVPFIPSWDCHGLPIEHEVEKKIGKLKKDIPKKKFRSLCRSYALQQVENQKKDFIKLGVLGDWKNSFLTMNPKSEGNIIKQLSKLIKNNHLYRGFKPVHWCFECQSSLSDAEIEHQEKKSDSAIVLFKAIDTDILKKIFKININLNNYSIYLPIWTTTIWSLPSNKAIAVHPDFEYQLIQIKNNFLILEKKLTKKTMEKIGVLNWNPITSFTGKKLEKLYFLHPFLEITTPVILSKHVTSKIGTGAIHIAPDHGPEDYDICKKYKIKISNNIDKNGIFLSGTHKLLTNIHIYKSIDIIIKLLKKNNNLLHLEKIRHNYPHCWRHKSAVIFRTTPQWFIGLDKNNLRNTALKFVKDIKWIPNWGKKRMESMLLTRPDWCISRQRTWGVPIPFFIHKKTKELHPSTEFILKKISKKVSNSGIEIWWDLNLKEIVKENSDMYYKSTDILDVWFESGSMKISDIYINDTKKEEISDICLEGSDQYRGWFMSSILLSSATIKKSPFKTIFTHGFTVDQQGYKMSKSIGNTINPKKIITTLGADILRLWVASTDVSENISISHEMLKQTSDHYRKIRNTIRFCLSNLYDFNIKTDLLSSCKMILLDQWIIEKTKSTQEKIISSYKAYRIHDVFQTILYFCSIYLSSFYFDIIKDRLYTTKKNGIIRKSAQTSLYHILHAIIRWIAPILPFTADESWNYSPGKNSKYIFTKNWYDQLFNLPKNTEINNLFWKKIIAIKNEVNKILEKWKLKKIIKNSLEVSVTIYLDKKNKNILNVLNNELKFAFLTSKANIEEYHKAPLEAYCSSKIKKLKIYLKKIQGTKCLRCWHYFSSENKIIEKEKMQNICNRCKDNILKQGEKRFFL
ncbi:isoleucine--tRNA ligase [Buchnera aphidicola (Mindarus keteleerifoliae)]|uniref:isoleucine--tRNA ligase n=1 Tax=Buchnera aphidicola TaxID=9 RepID=UPI0031B73CF1